MQVLERVLILTHNRADNINWCSYNVSWNCMKPKSSQLKLNTPLVCFVCKQMHIFICIYPYTSILWKTILNGCLHTKVYCELKLENIIIAQAPAQIFSFWEVEYFISFLNNYIILYYFPQWTLAFVELKYYGGANNKKIMHKICGN